MDGTSPNWDKIEARLGLQDPAMFSQRHIVPLFEDLPNRGSGASDDWKKGFRAPMVTGFWIFGITFVGLMVFLPSSFFFGFLLFLLFIPLFFLSFAVGFYLHRGKFMAAFAQGQERFIARSRALDRLADAVGLSYVPTPGGAPPLLTYFAKFRFAPDAVREAVTLLNDHGGMDEPLEVARRSGTMLADVTVLGAPDKIEKYKADAVANVRVEDGFQGTVSGVPFSAFEWVQPVEDSDDLFHLCIIFDLPRQLHGITQLRSRHISWPGRMEDISLSPVGVVAPAFEDRFRMRSTDQVEARTVFDPAVLERVADLAHGEKVRAVAYGQHLVVDIEGGDDRFAMIDLLSGEWSAQRIADSMIHIAEMRELAEAVAASFRLS